MSLLLDALKKAAEEKARKKAEESDRTESVTDTQPITGQQDVTDLTDDQLVLSTSGQNKQPSSALDETISDNITDTAFLDRTEIDGTEIDGTEIDGTEIDGTEIDGTEIDGTEIDGTELDQSELDEVDIDHTELDITHIERTEIDSAHQDDTHFNPPGSTDSDQDVELVDSAESALSELDKVDPDSTELDEISYSNIYADTPDADITDLTDSSTEFTSITGEDRTMLIFDEDDDEDGDKEFPSLEPGDDLTDINEFDQDYLVDDEVSIPEAELTADDVTEFMGDGIRQNENTVIRAEEPDSLMGQDDTTLTNSDSLSLTQVDFDGLILDKDDTRTSTDSLNGYAGFVPENSDELAMEPIDDYTEADKSTVLRSNTSISDFDIERLTNDETVTIKDSTSTRTFAPDNYDRTLMNLSDQDVSRIFPGMKPDAGAVMTPDYARKVFLSKSSNVKTYYYKLYATIAAVLLLSVVVWGLFELQTESDMIDNSLVHLKRDPMPGIIAPKKPDQSTNLFAKQTEANEKARALLTASEGDGPLQHQSKTIDQQEEMAEKSNSMAGTVDSDPQSSSGLDAVAEKAEAEQAKPEQAHVPSSEQAAASTIVASQTVAPTRQSASSVQAAPKSNLQVSSGSRMDKKAQLLTIAYQAYEQGDFNSARKNYDQVLAQDGDNRDALLGRAAIHILENEYDAAIQNYQQLLLANPKDSMAMTSLISVANIEPKVGESQLKTLIRDQPSSAYLHFALGNMYGSQNRWNEAQTSYFQSLKFKPQDPNYAYNLAVSLEHLGKGKAATGFYQRALDNVPNALATFNSNLVQQRIEVLSQ